MRRPWLSPPTKLRVCEVVVMLWLGRSIRRLISNPRVLLARLYTRMIFLGNLQERVIYRTLRRQINQLLFVCQGNICRSPLAAVYIKARLREQGRHISVRSAGLETTAGKEAHPLAGAVAQQHGLSLQAHVTMPLTREMVHQADLILVMEFSHRYNLLQTYPDAKGKVFQLSYFNDRFSTEIRDPYDGGLKDFDACYQVIGESCDNLLRHIIGTTN